MTSFNLVASDRFVRKPQWSNIHTNFRNVFSLSWTMARGKIWHSLHFTFKKHDHVLSANLN